jgi:hypothetical protein
VSAMAGICRMPGSLARRADPLAGADARSIGTNFASVNHVLSPKKIS